MNLHNLNIVDFIINRTHNHIIVRSQSNVDFCEFTAFSSLDRYPQITVLDTAPDILRNLEVHKFGENG